MNITLRKVSYAFDWFAYMGVLVMLFGVGWLFFGAVGLVLLELTPWFPIKTTVLRGDLLTGMVFGTIGSIGAVFFVWMSGWHKGPMRPKWTPEPPKPKAKISHLKLVKN